MQLGEGIRLAFLQIAQEKLKSTFSLLGVIIGVFFLIVVVSVVEGMDRYITEDLSRRYSASTRCRCGACRRSRWIRIPPNVVSGRADRA